MGNDKKALAAAIAANVIWGFSFMATRVALDHTTVPVLLSVRFTAGFIIMIILSAVGFGRITLKGKPILLFLLLGLCEPVIYFIAETNGIKYTTSSFSGLLISLIPVTTALLSVVTIHEHLSLKRLLWIVFSVAGVVIISTSQTAEGVISVKGIIYLLIAMTSASFYSIISRTISGQFSPFERTYVMMLMGCVVFTGYAFLEQGSNYFNAAAQAVTDPYVIIPVAFLSLVCSVTAFFCMNYAMSYLEVNRAVIFTNIIPVVSVIAGVLILGEPFSFVFVIGIIMILTGVYMVNKVQ